MSTSKDLSFGFLLVMSKEPPSQDFAKITQVPIRCHHFFEKNLHKGEINMDYASSLNHGDHGVATPVNQ